MISSAPDLKHILQKLNILGQRQIIQPVPVVLDCLGHFAPIYSRGYATENVFYLKCLQKHFNEITGTIEDTSPPPLSLSMTTSTTNLVTSNHRAGK